MAPQNVRYPKIQCLKGSEDYMLWSIRLKALLIKEKIIAAISQENHFKSEEALAYIQLHCEDGPLLQIQHCITAFAAWESLKSLYSPLGFTLEYLLIKELFNLNLNKFPSMELYLYKVKEITNELKSREIKVSSKIIIAWVLNSLDSSFENYVANITQSLRNNPNILDLEALFSSLLDKAKRLETIDSIWLINKKRL